MAVYRGLLDWRSDPFTPSHVCLCRTITMKNSKWLYSSHKSNLWQNAYWYTFLQKTVKTVSPLAVIPGWVCFGTITQRQLSLYRWRATHLPVVAPDWDVDRWWRLPRMKNRVKSWVNHAIHLRCKILDTLPWRRSRGVIHCSLELVHWAKQPQWRGHSQMVVVTVTLHCVFLTLTSAH